MARMLVIALLAAALALPLAAQPQVGMTFYVAPGGNDKWSGKLPAVNADRTDGPFATITRARDAIRDLKRSGGLTQPVTVRLREGTYFLSKTVIFEPQDSGTAEHPITYAAFPGEKPVISGGARVTGWTSTSVNGHPAWTASLPLVASGNWNFQQLFVNDQRRPRPRLPKDGYYRFASLPFDPRSVNWNAGQNQMPFSGDDLRQWRNLSDVDIVALHFWVDERLRVTSVDEAGHTVTFAYPSLYRMTDGQSRQPSRYYVENVFEALDTPGQWYLDRPSGTIYYLPQPGEDPQTASAIAPRLAQLLRFEGEPNGSPITYLNLEGLTFSHTIWRRPASRPAFHQAAADVPAAIFYQAAQSCTVRKCIIEHVGGYGLEIGAGCRDNTIVSNSFFDLGAGGVKLWHGSAATTLSDNRIHNGGFIFPSAVGVLVGSSAHNQILHNLVHNFRYTGISVGWTWGYADSPTMDNHIEYNHIYQIGRGVLDDMGGIYTLGVQPGTTVRNNFIHDCWSGNGTSARGIYLDEGSSQIVVENNVTLRTDHAGFMQNYGRDDLVQNNIFALARHCQLYRGRAEEPLSVTIRRNIFYFEGSEMLQGKWTGSNFEVDDNVYYNTSGAPLAFQGASFSQWQSRGHDLHSLIADPRLTGLAQNQVAVEPGSPAFALGFKPIDLSQVGPR